MLLNRRLVALNLLNRPVALLPSIAKSTVEALLDDSGIDTAAPQINDDNPIGYDVVCGIACIEATGTLLQTTGLARPFFGFTGFDGIRANLLHALSNKAVKGIVLDINSGGGEVAGMLDLSDTIYNARGTKPIASIVSDACYSAAYCIASAADFITVPRTGGVGSVGIISMLTDYSKAIKASGLQVHFVHFGLEKALETRQAHEGIEQNLLDRVQKDVDMMGELFVQTVARNRGLSATDVRNQQADYYLGQAGVKMGLADAVIAPDAAFDAFLNTCNDL